MPSTSSIISFQSLGFLGVSWADRLLGVWDWPMMARSLPMKSWFYVPHMDGSETGCDWSWMGSV